jgi:ABC-type Mn2+/Zn2+ transport system ATPase subunit
MTSDHSLIARMNGGIVFHSDGKWLHPLLDLEDEIHRRGWDGALLELEDKIVGRAAAFLMVRLGVRRVFAHVLSRIAEDVFVSYGVDYRYGELVPRIACKTEEILANIDDPEEAAILVQRRAGRETNIPLVVESLHAGRDGRPVLKNLTFAAARGDKVVIRGPNGAGKSTLLRVILGLVKKDSGMVLINGKEQPVPDPAHLGFLGQGVTVSDFKITVEEAVETGTHRFSCPPGERSERIGRALAVTGMEGFRKRMMGTLSGGEARRCELARCFAQEPEILLLDEPVSNLDPESKGEVLAVLERYGHNRDATVIMVTHEESHFRLAGWRYHLLDHGRLYPEGRR